MSRRLLIALILALLAIGLSQIPAHAACSGVQVPNTANLAAVVEKYVAGTTYCLASGSFEVATPVLFERGDKFLGASASFGADCQVTPTGYRVCNVAASSRVIGTSSTIYVIFRYKGTGGSATSVCRNLDISGARRDPANNNSGYGIQAQGSVWDIQMCRVHGNANLGLGSIKGLVQNAEIDNNGVGGLDGYRGGFKAVGGNMTANRAYIHDNTGSGAWCDGCEDIDGDGPFAVTNSRIVHNTHSGIHWEISNTSATIAGNIIQRNNWSNPAPQYRAGVKVTSSRDANIFNNTFGGNVSAGFRAAKDKRGYTLANILFHGNKMDGDVIVGCGSGVTCYGNS